MAHKNNDFNKQLGQSIRRWREHQGITQAQIGDRLGVTFQQVQKYERGANRISSEALVILADCFGITPNDLLQIDRLTLRPGHHEVIQILEAIPDNQLKQDWLAFGRALARRK